MSDWNGGLPPVGTVCAAKHADFGKHDVEVMARSKGYVWVRKVGAVLNCHAVWVECDIDYSPIRTAEEVAVEAIGEVLFSPGTDESYAHRLYAAIRDGRIPGVKLEVES